MEYVLNYLDFFTSVLKLFTYGFAIFIMLRAAYNAKFGQLIANIHDSKHDQASWMRAVGSVIVIFAMIIAFYQIYKTGETQEGLIIGLIGLALAGKVGQKFAEK